MDDRVTAVLDRLYADAERHDAGQADRLLRWRVLERPAGRLLWFLVQAAGARDVVEIGTSRGVSTLWLADAVRATGGHVLSLDVDAAAQRDAAGALARAGLEDYVTLRTGDGGAALADLPDGGTDLLFLDAERPEYPRWWPHPVRVLRPRGILVLDNALSHPEEIAPTAALIDAEPALTATTVDAGKGELMALRVPG